MQTSQTITKIAAALLKAQSEMSNAKKDAINPFFNKTYADLNAIREAVLPVLNKNGISAIQPTCIIDGADYVETVLLHESGEFISSLTRIVVDKVNDAQRHGSGLSYARRYALQSIVNIGAEDDDANKAVAPLPPAKQKQPTDAVKAVAPLPPAKQKQPTDAVKAEELASAIAGLALAETKQDLIDFKKTLPAYIVEDASFKAAGKERYNVIMAKPATA